MAKLSRAEAIEAFEKGPNDSTSRIEFEREMEKVRAGADSQSSSKDTQEDVEGSESDPEILEISGAHSSNDAAGNKTTEPKKDNSDASASQKTETKDEVVDPIEARLELMERELKLRDLRAEKLQVQLENRDRLARQRASDIGNLKKAPARAADREDDELTSLLSDTNTDRASKDEDGWRQGVTVELAQRAMQDEMVAFAGENEDADEYLDKMIPYVEQHRQDYFAELSSGNPKAVRRATNLLLREAFVAAKEAKYSEELDTLRTTRQKQLEDLRERKQGASASGGSASEAGGAGRPAAKKSLKDLSDDELRTLINARRNG